MSFIFVLGSYFLCNPSVTKSSLFNITFTNNITIYNHKDYTGTHNALDSSEHIILSPAILILIFTFLYKTKNMILFMQAIGITYKFIIYIKNNYFIITLYLTFFIFKNVYTMNKNISIYTYTVMNKYI